MRFRRKLLAKTVLNTLAYKHENGVPISRLIRDHELNVSGTHLFKLITWFNIEDNTVQLSLFPDWVTKKEIDGMIEQPYNYIYKGLFPHGCWEKLGA